MNKIYFFIFMVVVMAVLYLVGVEVGKNKCLVVHQTDTTQQQTNIIKLQRDIDEKTVNHNTGDIRRVLREKYTIAE